MHATTHRATPTRWVAVALVVLSVPAITGLLRLAQRFGGPHLMPVNPGIAASPPPVIVHIACSSSRTVSRQTRSPAATGAPS